MSEVKSNSLLGSEYRMNEEHIKIICKEWPRIEVMECLGEGGFGTVYKVKKHTANSDIVQNMAVKIVSLPKDMGELNAYFWDLQSEAEEKERVIQELVDKAKKEIQLEMELKNSHIITIHDHAIIKKEDGLGYYVLIAMDLLENFEPYMKKTFTGSKEEVEAVAKKVGCDICDALIACEKKNVVHRDIKPNNILVNENGDFILTDFGLAKEIDMMASRSNTGTPAYRAPEVESGKYGEDAKKIDIYSLGIVLYQICNYGRFPFLPPYPEKIGLAAHAEAYQKKMQGDPMPLPQNCSEEFGRVIMKACEFVPGKRYTDAQSFKNAIMNPSMQAEESINTLVEETQQAQIVVKTEQRQEPVITEVETQQQQVVTRMEVQQESIAVEKATPKNQEVTEMETQQEPIAIDVEAYKAKEVMNTKEERKKKKGPFVIIAVILLVVLIGAGAVYFVLLKSDDKSVSAERETPKEVVVEPEEMMAAQDEEEIATVVEETVGNIDLYELFSQGEMTYEEVLSELEKLNMDATEKQALKTKLNNMESSHSAYEKGKAYYDNGFYKEAKEQLAFVLEEDGYFADAEYMMNTCNSMLEGTILASAEEYANVGNYEEAIKYLTEYIASVESSVQADVALMKYQNAYADSVIQQTDELLAQEAYDEAIVVMEAAVEILPENQAVTTKYEECLQYKPADLSVLPIPELTDGCYVTSDEQEAKDTIGNVYNGKSKALSVKGTYGKDGIASIYLGSNYNNLKFTLACGNETGTNLNDGYINVKIYIDDELVDSFEVTRSFVPIELTYDITDKNILKIEVSRENYAWDVLAVVVSDVKAWN